MKIVTFNSSPRKPGVSRTSLMLRHLVAGMRDAGAEVESFNIHDSTIEYCTACFACFNKRFNETELCIFKDDMTRELLPKWKQADLVVYASPVFFHSITAKLKTFFERTLPVYVSFNSEGTGGSYDPAKTGAHPALAFVSVSGSPEDSAFDDYRNYIRCFEPVAEIYRTGSTLMSLPFCKDRVADVLSATEEAGRELVRDLRISSATMARITQPLHDDAEFISKIATAHQTLLPGHRALMTFPTEAKRELRALPSQGPSSLQTTATATVVPTPPVEVVSTSSSIGAPSIRRKRVSVACSATADIDAKLLSLLEDRPRQEGPAGPAIPGGRPAPLPPAVPPSLAADEPQPRPAAAPADTIAIIGISGRFATAPDLEALWQALESGSDLVSEVTRWELNARYAQSPGYGRHGGLLPDIASFDALFFKIAGNEAAYMDPQQRIFLEESWLALEDAGYANSSISALHCGVYVGCSDGDYRDLFPAKTPPQAFWGNAPSVIASRIAYALDLKGPAVAIDTACSSALVAVHMACQALRCGEIDMAVSGGVFVQCTPRLFDAANNAGMLSPTGHCHAFDDRADGFVIGEGAGALVLKRLDRALAAGDHIHGVIRASGTNQDGATNGITAPSAISQEQLISKVYRDAAIDPASVQMVEAHGTGTKLGDPIEFRALAKAFTGDGSRKPSLAPGTISLGSIKTNIGHAGAAAGAAGIFKALLAMRHGIVPPSLYFERANPLVALEGSPFEVPSQAKPWPRTEGPRRAVVSSFGFSGTNAHVVIEQHQEATPPSPPAAGHLFVISGRTPQQLARTVEQFRAHVARLGDALDLGHASFTLSTGRMHRRCRFACVVQTHAELLEALEGVQCASVGSDENAESAPRDATRLREGAARIAAAPRLSGAERLEQLRLIAEDYMAGLDLDLAPLFAQGGLHRVSLPGTVLTRTRHWVDARPPSPPEEKVRAPDYRNHDTHLVGDVFLAPVFEPVHLLRQESAAGEAVLFASPGADPALIHAFKGVAGLKLVMLEATDDDQVLAARIDGALAGRTRIIWLAPAPEQGSSSLRHVAAAQANGLILLYRAARMMLDFGHGARRLDWTIVVQQTLPLHGEACYPDHAAIHGFAGSLAKEIERWRMRVADVPLVSDFGAGLAQELCRLPDGPGGISFYGRDIGGQRRQWYQRRLMPAAPAAAAPTAAPYRRGGVFVVLGGAGGIGRAWTEHVVRTSGARVVWIGRRPRDGAIEAACDEIATFGPRPHYISADAANGQALAKAREEIVAKFGRINGLVHSAIVLRDGATATMDLARFKEALDPKIDLTLNAVAAFAGDPLDFVLFFSSMISFTPAAGQGNYAAGSAFKDAVAARIARDLACPVKVMNWGYWGDVGIVASPEYRARMALHGMASISTGSAMRAIDVLFSQPINQLAFMASSRPVELPMIDALQVVALAPGPMQPSAAIHAAAAAPLQSELAILRPQMDVLQDIQSAAAPLVAAQIARVKVAKLRHAAPWLQGARVFLGALGQTDQWANAVDAAWANWNARREAWRTDADRHARAELADAAIRALPDVLEGRIPATQVLFPEGSSRLVEGLYRRNVLADAFNRWTANALVEETTRLASGGAGVKVLEIGAGTGGTTSAVLQQLEDQGAAGALTEYAYTDVSSAFLAAARAEFSARCSVANFRTLDIEKVPASQGFGEASYDIVLAANVLHAAGDVALALRHAKSLLRPGGLLVLNELSMHTLLTHITFGLLDSWWAARDADRRLAGGPALSPEGWTAVLQDEGFTAISFPAAPAHELGQQVVLARSDGMIRSPLATKGAAPSDAVATPALPIPSTSTTAPAASPVPAAQQNANIRGFERVILEQLSLTLGVDRASIDAGEAFADYGLDSLNAVQLVEALNGALGIELKAGDLYSHASTARLASHIASLGARPFETATAAADVAVTAPAVVSAPPESSAIAIIGVSARAGGAETLDALWAALAEGRNLIGESSRWPGVRHRGAFLEDIAGFDAGFFNITGLEARYMDPQQRAFLMESYRALENAGYAGESLAALRSRPVGVFAGCYPGDYFQLFGEDAPAQAMWGAAGSVIPARLSYFLDLQGPAISVDTACSSSLVAVHLACQSLLSGECSLAIAGGVALHSTPRFFSFAGRAGMLSASGRCHAFEERADGFVAGEGVGAIVLKPLAHALADGDYIHGVIRATGMNQDGASNGITAPNGAAQLRLMQDTFLRSGIDPESIGMVEAHGTGTKLGDPIEFDALREVFGAAPRGGSALGSIKATLGHTLAAAGLFGIFRALLAFRHETIPPMPDFESPNPALGLAASPFTINTAPLPWPKRVGSLPRRAGVSSFGFSGTNAHAILEEPPLHEASKPEPGGPLLFLLSAETTTQLRTMAQALAENCRIHRPALRSVSFTLLAGRRRHAMRLAWVAATHDELQDCLAAWLSGRPNPSVIFGEARTAQDAMEDAGSTMPLDVSGLLARAHRLVRGEDISWQDMFPVGTRRRTPLPTYPFLMERYWPPALQPGPAHNTAPPAPAADRPQRLLAEAWMPKPLSGRGDVLPARTVILATVQVRNLAERIAQQIPGSVIVDDSSLLPAGVEAVVDCTGCAEVKASDLAWLRVPQALARQGRGRYLCLTRGLAAVAEEEAVVAPDGRVLRGALARMLQNEYRRLASSHVDYALKDSDGVIAATAVAELAACGSDAWVAHRDGKRFVSTRVDSGVDGAPRAAIRLAPDRAVWITGGTRGLGLLCARHLVEGHGITRLILTGRQPVPLRVLWPELARAGGDLGHRFATYLALEAAGVTLRVQALDLSDKAAVTEAVREADAELGPIGALIHCAGVADAETTAFLRKTAEGVNRVLAPKVTGLEQMWAALARNGTSQAVLFSSLTAAEPSLAVGQSEYAMANAYLDAFARYHDGRDGGARQVISLQWPNWAQTGMGEVSSDVLRRSGYAALSDSEGLALLDRALAAPPAAVALPAVIIPTAETQVLAPDAQAPTVEPPSAQEGETALVDVEAWLTALVARELEMPVERVKPDVPFPDYGVDSILLTGIHGALSRALGTALDPTLLYTCPSVRTLSRWLREQQPAALQAVLPAVPPTAPPAQPSPHPRAADLPAPAVLLPETHSSGIAIIGMACRFPGAPDLDSYWELLRSGRSAIAPIPAVRHELGSGGHAALLAELDRFDPAFFGIPAADAAAMPAQARIVLETALACFCNAGYAQGEVKGKEIGVYLGARASAAPPDEVLAELRHPVRAVGQNYLAASVAQFFDLRGPATVLDAACSSALVAMNSAIQAMRCGELDAAIVGGVNVLDGDGPFRMFRKRGLANESGTFHVFDRRASGVILGEGCGMVMLKPVARALADGDAIHAVIDAVAVNNDGRTAGPSAPNLEAQIAVMASALRRAGRTPDEIGYIEVNGSGNEVTDLLELKAIAAAYGVQRTRPFGLGSVKPNIGHPLCAEGIASFIKVAAMLQHRVVVPCLSGAEPMVHADFDSLNCALVQAEAAFADDTPVAALNVFADGGTNAHAILSAWHEHRNPALIRSPLPIPAMNRQSMSRRSATVESPLAQLPTQAGAFALPRQNFWAQT